MRSILQNVTAYDLELKLGMRTGTVQQTITATYTMAADQPMTLRLSAAAPQTCVLPAITGGTAMQGRLHIIEAIGASAITVTAASADGSATVAVVSSGQMVLFEADATNTVWRTLGSGASGLTIADGQNIVLGTVTGTDIGTSTSQKLGFYGATPIVQPTTSAEAAVTTTAATSTSPVGYTTTTQANAIITLVNQLRSDLVALGLIKGA